MQRINLYSSAPLSTPLALAVLGLAATGFRVEQRPLADLPAGPGVRRASLRAELQRICVDLAFIGERFNAHDEGIRRLDAGEEEGLKFDRDMLLTRKRSLEAQLGEGGVSRG